MLRCSLTRLAEHVPSAVSTGQVLASQIPPNVGNKKSVKKEGDFSSVFASLSKDQSAPLPDRFKQLKKEIVGNNVEALYDSWKCLIRSLKEDIDIIKESGNKVVPVVDYSSLRDLSVAKQTEIKHRGVCVIKGVFGPNEAIALKEETKRYIQANPATKGFPAEKPTIFELYWSPSQIKARADPRMLSLQSFFLSLWHHSSKPAERSFISPLTYADRLRIRPPGDLRFAIGPHVDGGSVERWEDPAYRSCYQKIFSGKWWEFDAFDLGARAGLDGNVLNMNMYETAGGCSVYRAWQGWLSMSSTGPGEGTLRVLPLTRTATAYWLLRPFFSPPSSMSSSLTGWEPSIDTPYLQGATPGRGQEMNADLHPHLELTEGVLGSVVSVPHVEPGDVVMWHADLIHAVESRHGGPSDSSVMYIPAAPSTPQNLAYIQQQRQSFLDGTPPLDFPGGVGESSHVGRGTRDMIEAVGGKPALEAMGL